MEDPKTLKRPEFNFDVYLVCHSHQDLGWERTISKYYNSKVRTIFDNLWSEFEQDKRHKKFVIENLGYLKAYLEENKQKLNPKEYFEKLKQLQNWLMDGRIELTNMSVSSPDESITSFKNLIENFRIGYEFVKTELLQKLTLP